MRLLLILATMLAATPAAAQSAEWPACAWSGIPQVQRDGLMLAYARGGSDAFGEELRAFPKDAIVTSIMRCGFSGQGDGQWSIAGEVFAAFAMEEVALNAVVQETRKPRRTLADLWSELSAQQRQVYRDIVNGGEMTEAVVDVVMDAAEAHDIDLGGDGDDTKVSDALFTMFLGRALREEAEARLAANR